MRNGTRKAVDRNTHDTIVDTEANHMLAVVVVVVNLGTVVGIMIREREVVVAVAVDKLVEVVVVVEVR